MSRERLRIGPALAGALAGVMSLLPASPAVAVTAEESCAQADVVLAVQEADGALAEMDVCISEPAFSAATVVDTRDWRGFRGLAAVRDGAATIVYGTTTDGRLLWHRRETAGQPFSAGVQIGAGIDWAAAGGRLLVPYRGQLAVIAGYDGTGFLATSARIFRHDGWASGAAAMTEEPPLQWEPMIERVLSIEWGHYLEATSEGAHLRLHVGGWYNYGSPGPGRSLVRSGSRLYHLTWPDGAVVLQGEPVRRKPPVAPAKLAQSATGGYGLIVATVDRAPTDARTFDAMPPKQCSFCPVPWEWQ
jgi:hypothetical protein